MSIERGDPSYRRSGYPPKIKVAADYSQLTKSGSARIDESMREIAPGGIRVKPLFLKKRIFHPSWKARKFSGNGTVLLGGMLLIALARGGC